MNETKKKPATAPVKTIRHGAIAASIWKRQATSGFEYFDFTVSRSWKTSATGKEGYSSSFFARNAEDLHAVIQEAANWMESQPTGKQRLQKPVDPAESGVSRSALPTSSRCLVETSRSGTTRRKDSATTEPQQRTRHLS